MASKNDLKKFGKMSREEIITEILNKGEFQMTDMEREDQLEKKKLDIATWISSQCINSQDGNQFPPNIILKAMKEANVKVNLQKPAKVQGLQMLGDLKKILPLEREKMHVKITFKTQEQVDCLLKNLLETNPDEFKETSQT